MRKCALLGLVAALITIAVGAHAQEFRATISGTVTDASGAAVPGVTVTATETRTITRSVALTDGSGQYVVPFLAPGEYDLAAELSGFKTYSRGAIHLASGDHAILDLRLELGSISESVSVHADPSLVNSANASISQTITTKEVEDLPLNGRTPMMLAQLAVGVIATSNPSLVHPFDINAAAAWSIGGTPSQTSELLLDGSPNEIWSGSLAYSPPVDAVQEVSVKAFDTDAAYGHTFGGTINQILKTGTNAFHGSAYTFSQPSALATNTFFNDRTGTPKATTKYNQYGITAGGPLQRNKVFWFIAWEGLHDSQPSTDITTVPTDAERAGDFSALLSLGPQYQIYNPYSGAQVGNAITRQPFGNNVIPRNLLNPVSLAYLQYFPEPNLAGDSTGFHNYINNASSMDSFNNEIGRVDYTVSDRSRLAFNVRHNNRSQVTKNYFNNAATGTTASRTNWGGTADAVYSFNSTTVLDVRGNVTYFGETHGAPSAGLDPTVLGFPSYMTSASQYLQMPFIAFAGSCVSQASIQCLGATGANSVPSRSYQVFADLVKNIDRHALKIGTDVRRYRLDNISYGNSAGTFTFGTNWTAGPNSASAAAPFGQDFAAFLLGLPTSGQYDVSAQGVFHSNYYAVFAQDDWRVSNTVTLNLGLRFERDTPYAEEQGRTVNGFDVNAISPIAAAAQAAYALHPIPQISAGAFGVRGGLTFPAASSGAVYDSGSSMLSPRIGFAWQPERLNGRTVFRGGYGVYVSAITMASLPPGGIYSSNPIVNQEGFSATTSFVPTLNNFLTPSATLTTPFSGGIAQPIGSSLGLSTFMGQTVSFLSPTMKAPYSRRWSVGVQRELGTSLMAEVDYLGNHTARLPVAVSQLNGIPRQYLSTLSTRDPTTINALSATVPNPFAGMLPGTTLNGSTTSVAQLLAAFPEFPVGTGSTSTGVLMQNNTIGTSDFESVSVRLQRRPTSGVMLSATYTLSRLMEADSYLNDTDTEPERRISPFDHTHHFVVAASYELPFGEGRAVQLRTNWARLAFEGWWVNGIYTYQTGAPLFWSNDMVYNGTPITLDPRNVDGPAFNTSAFDTNSKDQFQYHIRIFPSMFNSLRIDAINNLDASILKRFVTGRGSNLQIRLEIFNVLNHPTFSPPNVTPTSASFGMVTSQANLPRQAQIGVRFVF